MLISWANDWSLENVMVAPFIFTHVTDWYLICPSWFIGLAVGGLATDVNKIGTNNNASWWKNYEEEEDAEKDEALLPSSFQLDSPFQKKVVTDRPSDGRTVKPSHKDAWAHLTSVGHMFCSPSWFCPLTGLCPAPMTVGTTFPHEPLLTSSYAHHS